jgi:hypothetical protein
MTWLFADPQNVAVITHRRIVKDSHAITYVSHDADDGCWQFLPNLDVGLDSESAMLVSLKSIVEIDSSVQQIASLPPGWCAWRAAKGLPWTKRKQDQKSEFGQHQINFAHP